MSAARHILTILNPVTKVNIKVTSSKFNLKHQQRKTQNITIILLQFAKVVQIGLMLKQLITIMRFSS